MEMRLFIGLCRKNNMRVFFKYRRNAIHHNNLCLTSIRLLIIKCYGVTIKLIVKWGTFSGLEKSIKNSNFDEYVVNEKGLGNAGKGTKSNGYKVSNGSDTIIAKADLKNPVVQSRINVKTGDTEAEAKVILNSLDTAKIPISNTRSSYNKITGQTDTFYERVITLDKNIGMDKFSGKPTNTMTILTDKKGNP